MDNQQLLYPERLTPYALALIESGIEPPSDLPIKDQMTIAQEAMERCHLELTGRDNKEKYMKYFTNACRWLLKLPVDMQIAAVRTGVKDGFDKIMKYYLTDIPEYRQIFKNIRATFPPQQ